MKLTGIYILTCRANGKQYVGQSFDLQRRINEHLSLKSQGCICIHNAIKKYGADNFDVELILYPSISQEALNALESWKIKQLGTLSPKGYNLKEGGGRNKYSQTSRRKMSTSANRYWENPKNRQKAGERGKGRIPWNKGKTTPENVRKKQRASANKRWQDPKEREKNSEAQRKRYQNPEERRKVGEPSKGRIPWNKGKTNPNRGKTKLDPHKDEVLALRKLGWSHRAIAKRFCVGATTVSRFLKKHLKETPDLSDVTQLRMDL